MTLFAPNIALIVVDMQPDFMPGGALACYEGDVIVHPIAQLLAEKAYQTVVATQDWHPVDHISFASNHPDQKPFNEISLYGHPQTLWPNHCVQNSSGAELHTAIDWRYADMILRKGTRQNVDSYSGFQENHDADGQRPSTGLAGWLHSRGITEVHVCGLARDFCVLWTAIDAVSAGFKAALLWDLTRPVTPESDTKTVQIMAEKGIALR